MKNKYLSLGEKMEKFAVPCVAAIFISSTLFIIQS